MGSTVVESCCALTHRVIVLHTLILLIYYCSDCASSLPLTHIALPDVQITLKSMSRFELVVISIKRCFPQLQYRVLFLIYSFFAVFSNVLYNSFISVEEITLNSCWLVGESDRDRCSKLLHLHWSGVVSRFKRIQNDAVSPAISLRYKNTITSTGKNTTLGEQKSMNNPTNSPCLILQDVFFI